MSEPNVLSSLPDKPLLDSKIERIADSDAVDWTEPLLRGEGERENVVSGWLLEVNGTVHALFYAMDHWVSKGSFDADGLSDDEKRERGRELLGA
ncbi:hypothetical protein [Halorussus halophilus]|uniref:hypothetical protein n=1 Tax=Halorussus halophilus TaxID=2650975 RepID=UPI00130190DF|nr:hypothetical protein [Halorussus halophilus]